VQFCTEISDRQKEPAVVEERDLLSLHNLEMRREREMDGLSSHFSRGGKQNKKSKHAFSIAFGSA